MYKLRVYFAAGWFTDNQIVTYDRMSRIIDSYKEFDIFYPKKESEDLQSSLGLKSTREEIFNRNIQAMLQADLIVCSTEDKDMGSIWEGGFCYAKKIPTVYVNFHLGKGSFNLMLTESALAIARDEQTFEKILKRILKIGFGDPKAFEEFRQEDSAE